MRCFLFVFYIQSLARLFEYPVFVYNRLHYHAAVFYKIEKEGKKRRSAHGGGNFRDKECRAKKERKVPFLGQKKGEPARRTCRIIVKKSAEYPLLLYRKTESRFLVAVWKGAGRFSVKAYVF